MLKNGKKMGQNLKVNPKQGWGSKE